MEGIFGHHLVAGNGDLNAVGLGGLCFVNAGAGGGVSNGAGSRGVGNRAVGGGVGVGLGIFGCGAGSPAGIGVSASVGASAGFGTSAVARNAKCPSTPKGSDSETS